ncbi:MAG: phosphate/phosphite/phosphonate ABC transporter substrate-binding protein [Candidatus Binatia bacterium]
MKRRKKHIFFGIIILLIFAVYHGGEIEAQMQAEPRVETITLGIVHENPRRSIEQHLDFVNYVATKLSSTSAIKGSVVVERTPLQLAKLLNEKRVDFYMESAYPTFLINEQTGARVLLRRWKGAVTETRGVIFTRRDSGITRLEDLLGKVIAFEDPGSTSAYFLPKAFLVRKGFKLTERASFQEDVSPKEIGYLFAYDEENIINWVILRKVAAGAFSNLDFEKFGEKRKAEIVILAETESVTRHLLSVRKDLDPALVTRLKEILLSMHQDEEGQRILKKTDRTSKFDLLPGGEEVMYKKIRELLRITQGR